MSVQSAQFSCSVVSKVRYSKWVYWYTDSDIHIDKKLSVQRVPSIEKMGDMKEV